MSCYRTPESEAEEGVVALVMPQRFSVCGGTGPEYSVVFREDGHRGRVPALQMIEKLGHEERDIDEFGDEGSLAFLTSYEARSLVDEIIDESTSAESRDHHVDIPRDTSGTEESGGSLVESVLRTVNEIIDQDNWPQQQTAPVKLQPESGSENNSAYDDRDEGYADGEEGYADLVEETVRQVLHDRRTDEEEMNVNATDLVESVLRSMDDVDVEDTMSMDGPTTSIAAQNLVDDLMGDVWTDEVSTDRSPSGSHTSDRSKEFVAGILNDIALDEDHSGDSTSGGSAEASDQSKEFVSGILSDLGVGTLGTESGDSSSLTVSNDAHQSVVASSSQDFVSGILDDMRMEDNEDDDT